MAIAVDIMTTRLHNSLVPEPNVTTTASKAKAFFPVKVRTALYRQMKSTAALRGESLSNLLERSFNALKEKEGDQFTVPLDQRPQNAALNQ